MTEQTPRVAVVLIFLDAARFIREAINSVLAQTFTDWELILVDDGSTDESSRIAKAYARQHPDRIRYLDHPNHANRGMSASRNAGVRISDSDYVAFIDADDVWLSHKLARQVAILDAQPAAALLYGAPQYWYGWTGALEDVDKDYVCDIGLEPDTLRRPPDLLTRLLDGTHTPCPSDVLFRRTAFDAVGGFEESFTGHLQLYEDQAFLSKIYARQPVFVTAECWDRYRVHDDSCGSVVTSSGREPDARLFFLRWLETYLARETLNDTAVHRALQSSIDEVMMPATEAAVATPAGSTRLAGWWLRANAAARAGLQRVPDSDLGIGVRIESVRQGAAHDIQVNHSRFRIEQGEAYVVSGRIRADAGGRAFVGMARSYPPWDGLGLYSPIDLDREWRRFEARFVATGSASNARIHVDLGEAGGSVALDDISLRGGPDNRRIVPDRP